MNLQDVNKWLIADDPKFNTNDDKIVQLCFMTSIIHHFSKKLKNQKEKYLTNTAYVEIQTSLSSLGKQPDVTS